MQLNGSWFLLQRHPLGSAIATLWNDELDYVTASATASNGGVENLNCIRDGEAQIGVAVTSIMYESMNGTGAFEGTPDPNLRVLAGLYYNPNQVVVSADSGFSINSSSIGINLPPEVEVISVTAAVGIPAIIQAPSNCLLRIKSLASVKPTYCASISSG